MSKSERKASKSTVQEKSLKLITKPVQTRLNIKKPGCFISPFLQSELEKRNHSVGPNNKRFFELFMRVDKTDKNFSAMIYLAVAIIDSR